MRWTSEDGEIPLQGLELNIIKALWDHLLEQLLKGFLGGQENYSIWTKCWKETNFSCSPSFLEAAEGTTSVLGSWSIAAPVCTGFPSCSFSSDTPDVSSWPASLYWYQLQVYRQTEEHFSLHCKLILKHKVIIYSAAWTLASFYEFVTEHNSCMFDYLYHKVSSKLTKEKSHFVDLWHLNAMLWLQQPQFQ